jgi:hypothetical protein
VAGGGQRRYRPALRCQAPQKRCRLADLVEPASARCAAVSPIDAAPSPPCHGWPVRCSRRQRCDSSPSVVDDGTGRIAKVRLVIPPKSKRARKFPIVWSENTTTSLSMFEKNPKTLGEPTAPHWRCWRLLWARLLAGQAAPAKGSGPIWSSSRHVGLLSIPPDIRTDRFALQNLPGRH